MMSNRTEDARGRVKRRMRGVRACALVVVVLVATMVAGLGSATAATATSGGGSPSGVILRKSMGALGFARPGEDYPLEAFVEYEGVDPRVVGWLARQRESRYFEWTVSPPTGSVRYYGGWKFKATQPGQYTIRVRYGPFVSKVLTVRVRSEYAGKYKGSIQVPAVPGVPAKMSDIEFTVDDAGRVTGSFHYGAGPLYTSGTFVGNVEIRHTFVSDRGQLSSVSGSQFTGVEDLFTPEQRKALAEAEAYADNWAQNNPGDGIDTGVFDDIRENEARLKESGALGGTQPELNLTFRSVGYSLNAEGYLNGNPVSATGASYSAE